MKQSFLAGLIGMIAGIIVITFIALSVWAIRLVLTLPGR